VIFAAELEGIGSGEDSGECPVCLMHETSSRSVNVDIPRETIRFSVKRLSVCTVRTCWEIPRPAVARTMFRAPKPQFGAKTTKSMPSPLLTSDFALPDELKAEIEASSRRFLEQWPEMLRAMIEKQGWQAKYREEITRLMSMAYHRGVNLPPYNLFEHLDDLAAATARARALNDAVEREERLPSAATPVPHETDNADVAHEKDNGQE